MSVAPPRRVALLGATLAAALLVGPLASGAVAAPAVARQTVGGSTQVVADVLGWFPAGSGFVPAGPSRLLDTRTGGAKVPAGGSVDVAVAGVAAVPSSGVSAAVLNVTVTEPDAGGYLTAFASGAGRPATSNLNYAAGATAANLVVSALGANGAVQLFLQQQSHVVVDLVGYLPSGAFVPAGPSRVVDTRGGAGPLQPGALVDPALGIPAGATAVVNLTATEAGGPGYLRAWSSDEPEPATSNVNYAPGLTVANLALVPVGPSGRVSVRANSGSTHVIVDVLGYLPAGTAVMVPAARVLDTRSGEGGVSGPVSNDATIDIPIAGRAGVPSPGVTPAAGSAIVNLTVTEPNGTGFLSAFASGTPWPGTSSLNFAKGQTAANLAIVQLGANGNASAYLRVVPPPPPPPGPPVPEGLPFAPSKRGDRGPHVQQLQLMLTFSSFWMGTPEGTFGHLTQQAVMAFQKYLGMPATGAANADTVRALAQFHDSGWWPQARSTTGNLIEVDKSKQLLFVIRDGRVLHTVNTSTGTEKSYTEWSELWQRYVSDVAHTYEGVLRVYRQVQDGWVEGELGEIYRPKYVKGGVAIHGSASIPNYPASHGCIRVSTAFMDTIWAYNLAPLGSTVWVYR